MKGHFKKKYFHCSGKKLHHKGFNEFSTLFKDLIKVGGIFKWEFDNYSRKAIIVLTHTVP